MFGLSWPELLLIGIVAVIAIGPKELPALMRNFGAWTKKGRAMVDELRQHWEDLPNQTGIEDMQKQADEIQKKGFKKFGVEDAKSKEPTSRKSGKG